MGEDPDTTIDQVMVVLAHPRPGSFNYALAHQVVISLLASGHQVAFHDFYA